MLKDESYTYLPPTTLNHFKQYRKEEKWVKKQPVKLGGQPYLGFTLELGLAKVGKDQWDTSGGVLNGYNHYLPDNQYSISPLLGLNGGYQFRIRPNLFFSLGVGCYKNLGFASSGRIQLVKDSHNDHLYDYSYKLRTASLMLETKLGWQFPASKITPFILVGVGAAINSADNYVEKAASESIIDRQLFKATNTVNFAYQLGAGISYPFNHEKSSLTVGYKLVDLGVAKLQRDSQFRLTTGKIKTHEVYIGYTQFLGN